jgi:bifunctional non-homologous end joining protein LigD
VPGVGDVAGLVALAADGAGALRVGSDRPAAVVFGLGGGSWADCCAVALRLQGMLSQLGLECFGKAEAEGGLEVHLPVGGGATFAATSAFARLVAEVLAGDDPDLVATTPGPGDGRVLVDWRANRAEATTVAPYSLPAEGALVSTPLAWDELDVGCVTAGRMLGRVERLGDLFAPVACLDQPLPRL